MTREIHFHETQAVQALSRVNGQVDCPHCEAQILIREFVQRNDCPACSATLALAAQKIE